MSATTVNSAPVTGDARAKTLPGLHPNHYRELQASGLTDETIQSAGIYSEARYDALSQILNRRRWPKRCAPAWVIPFRTPDGRETGYARVKPDNPRQSGDKPVKYESPRDRTNEVYFPPGMNGATENPVVELLITEGEKKALAAKQFGFPSVGLVGVFGWKDGRSEALLPALERIAWNGRLVYIVFDSDAADKPEIQGAETRLAALLANKGAKVLVARLPNGPPSEDGKPTKMGLDDYLVARGAVELRKLLAAAEEPAKPDALSIRRKASDADPATVAERILKAETVDELPRLRFWKGSFWFWKAGGYRARSNAEVRAGVVRNMNASYKGVTGTVVSNVIEQLRAQAMLSYEIEPPAWIGKPPRHWKPSDILATETGLVDLPTLVAGGDYLLPPTPRYFCPVALDYGFALDAPKPMEWLAFLDSLWPDDPESIETLQDWMGYCLTPDTTHQKILMLIGPKRSGKGAIARVLRALIGTANTCGPTLASLATHFGLWPLVGKTLAVISDARLGGRTDSFVVVERLLSISGEDALTIDRKMLEPITTTLLTRLMLLSNELPRLIDQSGAVSSRMVLLSLSRSFYGQEDRGLTARLLTELPGILLWAVAGWQRLQERGHFLQPASGEELIGELNNLTSPVGQFVRECCEVGPACNILSDDLYKAYTDWAEKHGRKYVEDDAGFGRALRAVVPMLQKARQRVSGDRAYVYGGVALKTDSSNGW